MTRTRVKNLISTQRGTILRRLSYYVARLVGHFLEQRGRRVVEPGQVVRRTGAQRVPRDLACVEIKVLRRVRPESSRRHPPSTRRLLDGVAMPIPYR